MNLPILATLDQIKKSYKTLALQCHPDKQINQKDDQDQTNSDFASLASSYHFLVKNKATYDKLLSLMLQDSLMSPSDKVNMLSGLDAIEAVRDDNKIEARCHQCEGEVLFQIDEEGQPLLSECNSCSLIFMLSLTASEMAELKSSLK